jgi:hypothetical protein
LELHPPTFLDLVQHFLLSSYQVDEKERAKLVRQLTGPTRTRDVPNEPKIVDWAPAWWHGDEDATKSNMAAMTALMRK